MITQLNGQEYEYVKQIDYDYFEQKAYMKYGNNTETVYNYSPELRRLQNLNVKASDGQSMFNNAYSYDKVGNITKIENNADFNTTNYMGGVYENIYDYDNLNRLIRAKGGFTGFISRGTGHNLQAYNLKMDYNDTPRCRANPPAAARIPSRGNPIKKNGDPMARICLVMDSADL